MKPLFLDLESVTYVIALAPATVQKLVRENRFPKPRQLSDRRVAWLTREVEEWAESRPISDLLPPPNTGHSNRRRAKPQNPSMNARHNDAPFLAQTLRT
ncbi:helix-turn-helix transcriptional regulator [Paraburkholderia ferrariae]|uniref:helix-turn-helix transcriptional regulator n=1 Tax=Paraburkholderia ferrariae TaxID=386056 RepID=UPI000A06927F|nr:AlpA family phage regulatory protein [Paraburkholderia ferrariae]